LVEVPYAGHGGKAALAHDLQVTYASLKFWLVGTQEPSYPNREAIAALAREKGFPE